MRICTRYFGRFIGTGGGPGTVIVELLADMHSVGSIKVILEKKTVICSPKGYRISSSHNHADAETPNGEMPPGSWTPGSSFNRVHLPINASFLQEQNHGSGKMQRIVY